MALRVRAELLALQPLVAALSAAAFSFPPTSLSLSSEDAATKGLGALRWRARRTAVAVAAPRPQGPLLQPLPWSTHRRGRGIPGGAGRPPLESTFVTV